MKLLHKSFLFFFAVLIAGCGVSPRVRVEPTAATTATQQRAAVIAAQRPARSNANAQTVVRGDTLYSIAFRNGLDVRDLIAWNGMVAPYTIYPGQQLHLSAKAIAARPAAPAERTVATPAAATAATTSTTASGQVTLAAAPRQSIPMATTALGPRAVDDVEQPARVESLAPMPANAAPSTAANGAATEPRQPGALIAAINAPPVSTPAAGALASPGFKAPPASESAAVTASTAVTAGIAASTTPAISNGSPPSSTSTLPASATLAPPRIDASGASQNREGILWRWPTAGSVIGKFIAGDPTQQGIDIGGKLGQSVLAVADGEVVYSGNGLLGYGEMIIVQHSPDYLSAYGHNQRRLAAEGEKVKSGQVIAEMGQRGSQVMLHFEVRRRGKPVDPMSYLPAR